MPELICHLLGDYCLQNHAMATKKTSSWRWAAIHVAFYMLPFLAVYRPSWAAIAVMAGTHLVIDRFRLARLWVNLWGIGCGGFLPRWFALSLWSFRGKPDPMPPVASPAPDFLAVWLLIIVDNTAHLAINHLSLRYL